MRDAGEWALLEVGLTKMHPELVTLLGRLKYRTSYGQNVLNHLVERPIGSMMASSLGIVTVTVSAPPPAHSARPPITGGSHALSGPRSPVDFRRPIKVSGSRHHNEVETAEAFWLYWSGGRPVEGPGPVHGECPESYVPRSSASIAASDLGGVKSIRMQPAASALVARSREVETSGPGSSRRDRPKLEEALIPGLAQLPSSESSPPSTPAR